MTEYCVDTTCRRATSLGYDVTLAGDAHLTRDNKVLSAASIIAHHNFLLDGFGAGEHVVRVRPTRLISKFINEPPKTETTDDHQTTE